MAKSTRKFEGGDVLLKALERHGVHTLFSVSGGPINSAYHASTRQGVRIVHTRHESAAGYMADAVFRATGQPGGALVTLGPGVTNMVTPAACAMAAGVPFIIIGGQASTKQMHKGAGMEFDTMSVMQQVTKWSAQILHADRIDEFVDEAFRRMTAGTPGPVYLEIPVDILSSPAQPSDEVAARPDLCAPAGVANQTLERVQDLFQNSERPLIIAGDGVHHSAAEGLLTSVVSRLGAATATLRLARGVIDETDSEYWIGPGYIPANPVFADALTSADLIVLLGHHWEFDLEFGQTVTPGTTVIQVHQDAALLGRNGAIDLGICADTGQFLAALDDVGVPKLDQVWVKELRNRWVTRRQSFLAPAPDEGDSATAPHPLAVVEAIVRACPEHTRFVTSHGNVDFWADMHLTVKYPRHYLRVGQSGALGAEIPFGVGSAIEDPTIPTIVFVGDGAVGYHIAELETAAREDATVIVVVLDDNLWGAIALPQQLDYGVEIAMDLPERDWAMVAEGLGARGRRVDLEQIASEVSKALADGGPTLLQVGVRSVLSPYMEHISK